MNSVIARLSNTLKRRRGSRQRPQLTPLSPHSEVHPREVQAVFQTLDGIDREKYIIVHYILTPNERLSLAQAAARIAIITSQSALTPLPYETLESRIALAGIVLSVQSNGQVIIGYPVELCTSREGITQLITLLISGGEYDFASQFWVEQTELPTRFLKQFTGPKFGVDGIRSKLQIHSRPIIGATIKTRGGVSLSEIEEQCHSCLLGGVDYIADDGLLIDPQSDMAFETRVPVLAKVAREVSEISGEQKWYIANVGAPPKRAKELIKIAESEGVGALRVNGFIMGFPTLSDIASDTNLPIICTNMGVGLLTRISPRRNMTSTGVSEAIISKLSRLAGADAVHLGSVNAGCYIQASWDPAIINLQATLQHIRSSFAVAAGNITIANVWDNISSFGCDLLIETDEGLLGYPWGSYEGAKAFRKFVENLPYTLSSKEAHERIFEMAQQDPHLSQALVYYDYQPKDRLSRYE